MSPAQKAKRLRFLRKCMKTALSETAKPVYSRLDLAGALALLPFLFVVWIAFGQETVEQEAALRAAALGSIIVLLPVYFLINLIRAPFIVAQEDKKLGHWDGTAFIYHEPKIVFTKLFTVEDNEKIFQIPLPDCEPYSFVSFYVKVKRGPDRIRTVILPGLSWGNGMAWARESHATAEPVGGSTSGKENRLTIKANMLPDTVPLIVRVYVTAWDLEPKNPKI